MYSSVPAHRYYARGVFASHAMTAAAPSAAAVASAPLPLLDWPLRHISGGSLCTGAQSVLKPESTFENFVIVSQHAGASVSISACCEEQQSSVPTAGIAAVPAAPAAQDKAVAAALWEACMQRARQD